MLRENLHALAIVLQLEEVTESLHNPSILCRRNNEYENIVIENKVRSTMTW